MEPQAHNRLSRRQFLAGMVAMPVAAAAAHRADYYYLRVQQSNGQMAWSSPVWVNSPG